MAVSVSHYYLKLLSNTTRHMSPVMHHSEPSGLLPFRARREENVLLQSNHEATLIIFNEITSNGPSDIWGIFLLAVNPTTQSVIDFVYWPHPGQAEFTVLLWCDMFSRSVPTCWSSCALTWSGSVPTTLLRFPSDKPSRKPEDTSRPDYTCRGRINNR